MLGPLRKADRDGDAPHSLELERDELLAEALAEREALRRVGSRKDDAELLATEPAYDVGAADGTE